MKTLTHSRSFTGSPSRPFGEVVLYGPTGSSPIINCLVDTGADCLQLPASYAASVGLSLAAGAGTTARTAGGPAVLVRIKGLQVDVEGVAIALDVLFDPANRQGLLGRNALQALQQIGFDFIANEWLWV